MKLYEVRIVERVDGKHGDVLLLRSCCWPAAGTVSGLAEEARLCAFSTQVLGSGCWKDVEE
jgi:hypothetical protein